MAPDGQDDGDGANDDFAEDAPTYLDIDAIPGTGSGPEVLADDGAIPEAVFHEPPTDPHDAQEWLAGWARGLGDGMEATLLALALELRSRGAPEAEVSNLTAKIRAVALGEMAA